LGSEGIGWFVKMGQKKKELTQRTQRRRGRREERDRKNPHPENRRVRHPAREFVRGAWVVEGEKFGK
jgi:hypothetical protein